MSLTHYSFEPVHYDVGMNYVVWGIHLLAAYDALRPELSPEKQAQVDSCLTRMAIAIARNDVFSVENNIGGAYGQRLKLSNVTLYEYAWSAWADLKYAWLLNQNTNRPVTSLYSSPHTAQRSGPANRFHFAARARLRIPPIARERTLLE
ncbi:MAG TPA: hypothetical protein PLW35_15870, partial [Verrucomicrobiota bacterium]|nr:hypothetical protein [Verrucomicrobiota bacterium]